MLHIVQQSFASQARKMLSDLFGWVLFEIYANIFFIDLQYKFWKTRDISFFLQTFYIYRKFQKYTGIFFIDSRNNFIKIQEMIPIKWTVFASSQQPQADSLNFIPYKNPINSAVSSHLIAARQHRQSSASTSWGTLITC